MRGLQPVTAPRPHLNKNFQQFGERILSHKLGLWGEGLIVGLYLVWPLKSVHV